MRNSGSQLLEQILDLKRPTSIKKKIPFGDPLTKIHDMPKGGHSAVELWIIMRSSSKGGRQGWWGFPEDIFSTGPVTQKQQQSGCPVLCIPEARTPLSHYPMGSCSTVMRNLAERLMQNRAIFHVTLC